jgi:hypothetical protein
MLFDQWSLLLSLPFQAMARLILIFILHRLSILEFNFSVLRPLMLQLRQLAISMQLFWNLFQLEPVLFKVINFGFIVMA